MAKKQLTLIVAATANPQQIATYRKGYFKSGLFSDKSAFSLLGIMANVKKTASCTNSASKEISLTKKSAVVILIK